MSFLAKLGSVLAKGVAILLGVEPLVAQYLGTKADSVAKEVVNDLTSVGQIVVSVEAVLGAGGGANKLKAAVPLVINVLKTSELVSHHKIADEALFTQAATDITNGVAELLNSLSSDGIKSSGDVVTDVPEPTKV